MTGKVFQQSENIYQDQAKLLFNYYMQSAEQIVSEEERIEHEIELLMSERSEIEAQKSKLWYWFLTLILFFMYFIKKKNLEEQIAQIDARIEEFKFQHNQIFRNYQVTRLGVVYTPIAKQVRYEDKSFIVDYTGSVPNSQVTLQMSRQGDLLSKTINNLSDIIAQVPLVETSNDSEVVETDEYSTSIQEITQNDYMGSLDHSLRTIAYCMEDLDSTSVALPLVSDGSDFQTFLNEFATTTLPNNTAVITVFDQERFEPSINCFQQINHAKDSLSTKTHQFEDVLKNLMVSMARSVQTISRLKVASVNKVVLESNKLLYQILKAPYNHYSPLLEHEEIERIRLEQFNYTDDVQGYEPFQLRPSSRMYLNLTTGMWTAEDGSTTTMPFGVHQIYEEIVAPIVQNLMNENRIERLKIYNNIRDQKLNYLNKWHQDTDAFYRANRAESSQLISQMQETMRQYVAAYNTLLSLRQTEENMSKSQSLESTKVDIVDNTAETVAAFETNTRQYQQLQEDFEEYIERLKEDIDERAERFGHVEYFDAKLRDGHFNEVAVASSPSAINSLDERSRPLALANPLLASSSQLPPAPRVEEVMHEHFSLNLPDMAEQALESLGDTPAEKTPALTDKDTEMTTPTPQSPTPPPIPTSETTDDTITQ